MAGVAADGFGEEFAGGLIEVDFEAGSDGADVANEFFGFPGGDGGKFLEGGVFLDEFVGFAAPVGFAGGGHQQVGGGGKLGEGAFEFGGEVGGGEGWVEEPDEAIARAKRGRHALVESLDHGLGVAGAVDFVEVEGLPGGVEDFLLEGLDGLGETKVVVTPVEVGRHGGSGDRADDILL